MTLDSIPPIGNENRQAAQVLDISVDEVEELQQAIRRAKGRVMLFVHPYYEEYHPEYSPDPQHFKEADRSERVTRRIEKFLSNAGPTTPPTFIYEERECIPRTRARLQKKFPLQKVYLIPTKRGRGIPQFDSTLKTQAENASLDTLAKCLQWIGAQRILFGGFSFSKDNQLCVNEARAGLKKYNFETEISSFTQPHTRTEAHPKPRRLRE